MGRRPKGFRNVSGFMFDSGIKTLRTIGPVAGLDSTGTLKTSGAELLKSL